MVPRFRPTLQRIQLLSGLVLLLGATGTIGRAAARAIADRGYRLRCLIRPEAAVDGLPTQAEISRGDPTNRATLERAGFANGPIDAVVSCLASRTGAPADAWAIDHDAHMSALAAAQTAGAKRFVLLSAICVQKPRLAFQQAKRAFEIALVSSGLTYSIVRPTAYFKSLSGQIARLQAGKPFVVFGDGRMTACKPISDRDLGTYIANCLEDERMADRILPIGGPGPAITPKEQGELLFKLLGREPRFRHAPLWLMDAVIAGLTIGGRVSTALAAKAEFARIGHYYASESMLVWNPAESRYDADATPSFGSDTLEDHYRAVLSGAAQVDLGAHAVF